MHSEHGSRRAMHRLHGWYEDEEDPRFLEAEHFGPCHAPHHHHLHMAMAGRGRGGRGGPWGFGGHGNPFGGNPFGGNPFARRPRMRRGDVRAAILVLLAEQPGNGYQIMQALEARSEGRWRPSPGSVYPTLQQLEDEGLIRAEDAGTGKLYHLTEAGEAEARRLNEAGKTPWADLADAEDDSHVAMFRQVHQIALACAQIAHAGDPRQAEEATKVLNDARKALYAILAQDEEE